MKKMHAKKVLRRNHSNWSPYSLSMADAHRETLRFDEPKAALEEVPPTRRSLDFIAPHRGVPKSTSLEYALRERVRKSLTITAILCIVTVVASPVGFWILFRLFGARVRISQSGLVARGIFRTVSFEFDDVDRLGVMEVRDAIHVIVKSRSRKAYRFLASNYEGHQAMVGEVMLRTRKPCETIRVGLFVPKWPEDIAFS